MATAARIFLVPAYGSSASRHNSTERASPFAAVRYPLSSALKSWRRHNVDRHKSASAVAPMARARRQRFRADNLGGYVPGLDPQTHSVALSA